MEISSMRKTFVQYMLEQAEKSTMQRMADTAMGPGRIAARAARGFIERNPITLMKKAKAAKESSEKKKSYTDVQAKAEAGHTVAPSQEEVGLMAKRATTPRQEAEIEASTHARRRNG